MTTMTNANGGAATVKFPAEEMRRRNNHKIRGSMKYLEVIKLGRYLEDNRERLLREKPARAEAAAEAAKALGFVVTEMAFTNLCRELGVRWHVRRQVTRPRAAGTAADGVLREVARRVVELTDSLGQGGRVPAAVREFLASATKESE